MDKTFTYITEEVHIKGIESCEHAWVENEDYENGELKQIICSVCGQFETAHKVYEPQHSSFDAIYKQFHEKIEPFKPMVLSEKERFDDYVSLVHVRGYLVDKRELGIAFMEEALEEAGLEGFQIFMESPYYVIGAELGKSQSGVLDLQLEKLIGISSTEKEKNDDEIKTSFLSLGFEEEHLKNLEIKNYVVGTYSY